MNINKMAPSARNGPKGILVLCVKLISFLFCWDRIKIKNPYNEPSIDPIVTLAQHPTMPVNEPINKRRSKSPSPIPSTLRKYLKIRLIINKKEYPNNAPEILSIKDNGSKPYALIRQPQGTKKIVTKLEMSIVSISDRIVTINAEKNMK
jgi:hypothetical protein